MTIRPAQTVPLGCSKTPLQIPYKKHKMRPLSHELGIASREEPHAFAQFIPLINFKKQCEKIFRELLSKKKPFLNPWERYMLESLRWILMGCFVLGWIAFHHKHRHDRYIHVQHTRRSKHLSLWKPDLSLHLTFPVDYPRDDTI